MKGYVTWIGSGVIVVGSIWAINEPQFGRMMVLWGVAIILVGLGRKLDRLDK